MTKRTLVSMIAAAVTLSFGGAAHARAGKEPIKLALCYDLSKVYTWVVPQYAQASRDYQQFINQRGGIEGHPIEFMIQDTGNEPQRGIECYEKMKPEGAIAFDFASTIVSRGMLPRLMKDQSVMIQPYNGRSDALDGEVFSWVFPVGPNYWSQMANAMQYIKTKSKNSLKGVKIAFVYVDHPFGHEQIPLLKLLQAREGFVLQQFPYALPGNDQGSTWSEVRRFNPDWILHWGYAAMHVVASKEMTRNGIPMSKYISPTWISEMDIANIGPDKAKGLKRSTGVVVGTDPTLVKQILEQVYDPGKGAGDRAKVGTVYYNMGLATAATVVEGARLAVKQFGWPATSDKMRRGMESIKGFTAGGLLAPVTVTAKDHGGGGKTRIDRWDGTKWVPETDWFAGFSDVVWEIVKKESAEWAKTSNQ